MTVTYDFTGQVALVTGASSGLGLTTARAFADAGAAIVLVAHHEPDLLAASDELQAAGHEALAVTCDVSDEEQVAEAVDAPSPPSVGSTSPSTTQASRRHRPTPPTRPPISTTGSSTSTSAVSGHR